MEAGTYWGKVDPETLDTFQALGQREQNAVKLALVGIKQWKETKVEPNPMKVTITPERPFSLKLFANMMQELGVDIASSYKRNKEDGSITFQPTPYDKSSIPRTKEEAKEAFKKVVSDILGVNLFR